MKKTTIKKVGRQYIIEATKEKISEMAITGQRLSFILLDIDKFKSINDTYGHQFGDLVLEKFAERLKGIVAHSGVVSRVGGEEFAVLLANMEVETAYKLGEEIRKDIEKIKIWNEDLNKNFTFTVSIGISSTSDPTVTFKEFFNQADRALYEAKENGRNQTKVSRLIQMESHKTG